MYLWTSQRQTVNPLLDISKDPLLGTFPVTWLFSPLTPEFDRINQLMLRMMETGFDVEVGDGKSCGNEKEEGSQSKLCC